MRVKNLEELQKLIARQHQQSDKELADKLAAKCQHKREDEQTLQPQRRIIGLDVALRTTGWGIIDTRTSPRRHAAVDCGVIKNQPTKKVSECLGHLAAATRELIGLYKPDIAVVEGGFYCQNVRTAISLGAARGAVIAALSEASIPVFEYAPRKIKQTVCGFGNASKQQVAILVAQFLNIQVSNIALDATDALAMALTHAQLSTTFPGLEPPQPI